MVCAVRKMPSAIIIMLSNVKHRRWTLLLVIYVYLYSVQLEYWPIHNTTKIKEEEEQKKTPRENTHIPSRCIYI